MDTTQYLDYPEETGTLVMAGFGPRLVAIIIDGLIIGVIVGITISLLLPLLVNMTTSETGMIIFGIIYVIGLPLLGILYQALFESSKHQGTPGKIALGIKVTDTLGEKISFAKAFGRNAAKIISGLILYVGYLMALWTDKKQCLHDMMANTYVVKK